MDMSYEIAIGQLGVVETHLRAIKGLNPGSDVAGHLAEISTAIDEVKKYLERNKGMLTRQPLEVYRSGQR
jgi:hypothetical protein